VNAAALPVVLVHGGAGRIDADRHGAALEGVSAAARRAQAILLGGGECEEAVVAAVGELEGRPDFNAGRGSVPNRDGGFEMDAAVMRSRDLASGAVAAVPDVLDPVAIAWRVLRDSPHCLLVGEGAVRFARAAGVGTFGRDLVRTRYADELFRKHFGPSASRDASTSPPDRDHGDTVGALALDRDGNLAAAGSTGGVLGKAPGRVGDTPLVGAGLYVHPELGAACATGMGEALIQLVASYAALRSIAAGREPEAAAADICREALSRWSAPVGLLVLRPDGTTALAHGSEHMSWALARGAAPVQAGLTYSRRL
jgi:beta-aspartyl-peptidase (threonine type)